MFAPGPRAVGFTIVWSEGVLFRSMMTYHVQFLLLVLAGWVNRQQQDVIDYLQEENRVLRAGLRGKRLRLSDDERRRLAVKAQALGREALAHIASVATPATLLRWYRHLIAAKDDGSKNRSPGRPPTAKDIRELIVRVARENGDVPPAVEFARVATAPVITLRQQTHRCQESVPVASPSRHRRWPEPRPDLDRNEDPTRRLLVARERANLVGLKLFGSEAGDPCLVESTTHLGCLLEPAGDGVPGNPFDPRNRGNADTLDSESDDFIESSSSMLETVVGRAFRRGERLSALAAPVSTAFPGPGSVESVANDVSGTDFAPQRTCEIETSAILHFGSALTMRELCLRNSDSNSSTQTG